jgi:Protein of unknown function (Hypoth_ymh)
MAGHASAGGHVEIADVEAALVKVRGFMATLMASDNLFSPGGTYSESQATEWKRVEGQIHEQLPLVLGIAARVDPSLPARLKHEDSYGWPYTDCLQACQELAGRLGSLDEAQRILGPAGPQLAAENLHPWIWNAAVNLWADGHRREAVQGAAHALFDSHLPAKLGMPPARSSKDLVSQAFSTDPPEDGKPRLRLTDYPGRTANWVSQHQGAMFLGMGCALVIRNLVTHGQQPDERTALEQLAALSPLARMIDSAVRVTL